MKVKVIVCLLVAMLVLGLVVSGCVAKAPEAAAPTPAKPAAPEVIKWRGQNQGSTTIAPYGPFGPGETGVWHSTRVFNEWLTKRTGGRLVIEWAEPGAIYPQGDTDINISQGTVPIATVYPTYYVGRVPEADIETSAIFFWEDSSQYWEALTKYGLMNEFRALYAKKNILWLPQPSDAIVGMGTNFPAPNAAAIKGHKIRSTGIWSEYVSLLGASPVVTTWGDFYMATKLGTVDGWIAGSASFEEIKLKETTKYYVRTPVISLAQGNMLINMDALKKLPQDIQDILRDEAPYILMVGSTGWHNQCLYALRNAESVYGLKVYDWPAEDIDRLTKQVVDTVYPKIAAKSPDCARMMDIVKKQMRDYGRIK